MKYAALVVYVLVSCVSFAQSQSLHTSPAGVNYFRQVSGDYFFQASNPEFASWSQTSSCVDQNNQVHTQTAGGSTAYLYMSYGTVNFGVSGSVSSSQTTYGFFDQQATNATIVIQWSQDGTCTLLNVNNGHAVFDPPQDTSKDGFYSLDPLTGQGEIDFFGSVPTPFQVGGVFTSCLQNGVQYVVANNFLAEGFSKSTPNLVTGAVVGEHSIENVKCGQ
jgi:hypothetical protein